MPHRASPDLRFAVSRRQILAGAAAALGSGVLAYPLRAAPLETKPRKQLLVFLLSGGASQLETWDPKPGTATGGPFRAIPTSIPGVHISELLPHTAKIMHRLTVVRSLDSKLSGHEPATYAMQAGRIVPGYPELGSAVAKLLERPEDVLPGHVVVHRTGSKGYTDLGGAGFLGAKYEPIRLIGNEPPKNLVRLPTVSETQSALIDRVRRSTDDRYRQRRELGPSAAYATTYDQAKALMERREIFDLSKESTADVDRYGKHEFGQNCLLARRLLSAGITSVKVTHFDWDSHTHNFHWQKLRCTEFDRTFSTFIEDLAERGMLEHTHVLVTSEMGRTPQIDNLGGRGHWGKAWSVVMAGSGVKPGMVYGSTTDDGMEVKDDKISLGDLFHTNLNALGIDSTASYAIAGQTNPVADPAAKPVDALLA